MPETLAEEIKKATGNRPVWQWVQEVLEERLTDEELNRQWEEFYRNVNPGPVPASAAAGAARRTTCGRQGRTSGGTWCRAEHIDVMDRAGHLSPVE